MVFAHYSRAFITNIFLVTTFSRTLTHVLYAAFSLISSLILSKTMQQLLFNNLDFHFISM